MYIYIYDFQETIGKTLQLHLVNIIYIYICYIYIYIYIYIYMYIYICIYIYIYICIYIYVYIYVHIYQLRGWDSLTMSFTGKFVYIQLTISPCYSSILLTLGLIGTDGGLSTPCHSCGFACQQCFLYICTYISTPRIGQSDYVTYW